MPGPHHRDHVVDHGLRVGRAVHAEQVAQQVVVLGGDAALEAARSGASVAAAPISTAEIAAEQNKGRVTNIMHVGAITTARACALACAVSPCASSALARALASALMSSTFAAFSVAASRRSSSGAAAGALGAPKTCATLTPRSGRGLGSRTPRWVGPQGPPRRRLTRHLRSLARRA